MTTFAPWIPDATRLAMLLAARRAMAEGRDARAAAAEAARALHPALPATLIAEASHALPVAEAPPAG